MITLYQYDACPFCNKVRAFLNYTQTPYKTVAVSRGGMKELEGITEHKKVPVITDSDNNDKVITESSDIVDYINQTYAKLPASNAGIEKDKEWTSWVDNTLVHYLPVLIYPNFKTAYKNIKKVSGDTGFKGILIPFFGALVMPKVARKMKEKRKIIDPQKEYLAAIEYWVKSGLKGQAFYGDDVPNLVDCSVFGVLRSGHTLGTVKMAMNHNKDFAIWYDKCYTLMSDERNANNRV